jgi:hypothetical protein
MKTSRKSATSEGICFAWGLLWQVFSSLRYLPIGAFLSHPNVSQLMPTAALLATKFCRERPC